MKTFKPKLVDKIKLPGVNPAMVDMSLFVAQLYNTIMVKQLGTALLKKLEEFAKDV